MCVSMWNLMKVLYGWETYLEQLKIIICKVKDDFLSMSLEQV
jgi:hypothetical protein